MHCTRNITEDLLWVGDSDRRLAQFENMFPIPRGVSYNSYLLLDDKTVLFDTADEAVGRRFLENVVHGLDGRMLDYLVVQHMEPDHGALIEEIVSRWPEVKIVCSAGAANMLNQFFTPAITERALTVSEGDKLMTGRHTLHFFMAPMVHWPEVMVTYDELSKTLFTADAFGMFGALAGNIFDDELCFDRAWMDDARRYYGNIVGKFGAQVQTLLKKAAALDIACICPLHGPVLREHIELMVDKYQKWSTYEPEENAVLLVYASMYGNTENAMNVLAAHLADAGVRNIALYDVSNTDVSVLIGECFRCSHLVLATPTYNGGLHPKMDAFLTDMKAVSVQNRTVALLDNGTWAPTAAKQMAARLETMKNMTVLEAPLSIRSVLTEAQAETLQALAQTIAAQLI